MAYLFAIDIKPENKVINIVTRFVSYWKPDSYKRCFCTYLLTNKIV